MIQRTCEEELESCVKFEVFIDKLDVWKFSRWLEIIESYDQSRKSTNSFNSLLKEIQEDYDKDFKSDDLW